MAKNSEKLSVGLVFDDSLDSNDGVAQYLKTLGAWLSSQGHQVSYLVGQTKLTSWRGGKVYSLARNIPVVFNGNRLSIPLPANKARIKQVMNSQQFDVVHVMMPHSPLMSQRVIKLAPKSTAIVGTFHIFPAGRLARWGGRLLSVWYGRNIRLISKVVSVSQPAQSYAKQTFRLESAVVPNPVDISRFADAGQIKRDPEQIVFLGRLVPRKGCAELLKAFALAGIDNIELIIAGDGPQRKSLENLARSLSLESKVKFLGYIDEKDKPELLAGASLACFPALYGESFGLVLIEAMAAGAGLVLGGDNPGYRSVLREQPKLVINPRDTKAFAERLKSLLDDKQTALKLHEWQKKVVKQYDINVVGAQILELYYEQIAQTVKKSNN